MMAYADNEAMRDGACVQCGHVDSPITVGPGPGWLAITLWGAAAAFWTLGMVLESIWLGYLAAPVFLGALIYTLWYFYRREKACRHCGTTWAAAEPAEGGLVDPAPEPTRPAEPTRPPEPTRPADPTDPADDRAGPGSAPR